MLLKSLEFSVPSSRVLAQKSVNINQSSSFSMISFYDFMAPMKQTSQFFLGQNKLASLKAMLV